MAEYLSPGVYVEEFDSGIKAMEGVGTSTAGFIGMAQKGPIKGLPVLITSMADYQRRFGGYLSERTHKELRYLPYAVEQFFNNGGSTCYVMRVCDENAGVKASVSDPGVSFLAMKAVNPGEWGNRIHAKFILTPKNKAQDIKVDENEGENNTKIYKCTLSDASAYQSGDIVYIQSASKSVRSFNRINEINDNTITLAWSIQLSGNSGDTGGGGDNNGGENSGDNNNGGENSGDNNNGGDNNDSKDESISLYLAEWRLMLWDDTMSEQYENVSFNPDRSNYIGQAVENSQMITAESVMDQLFENTLDNLIEDKRDPAFLVSFKDGSDGKIEFKASLYIGGGTSPDDRTGLEAFKTLSDVSIMAIPGITDKSVQSALVSHCEGLGSRFAILDMPMEAKEVSTLQEFRENVDSSYAAMYHPWVQCYDPLDNRNIFLPPSGSMAGIYGRTDNTRGVHKAPANEVVRNCTGLSVRYNEAEQGKLNPKGINLIRALPGQGIRVWGARTCSSDGNWKYINVRRLFIFVEESIKANTNWAVFEPNDEMLWSRVEGTIRVFLTTQWRNGALAGSTADEAFFINIGKSTMTEDDILNGRLICVIGIAPVRPAEFVVFRITQKMESAQ